MATFPTVSAVPVVFPGVEDAQRVLQRDQAAGLSRLNDVFRLGRPPETPLNGATSGQMIAVDMGPGITPLVEKLLRSRMPWCGKTFEASAARGENLFYPGFGPVARVMFPFYGGFRKVEGGRLSGLSFRTDLGAGLKDTDRQVLKIDYDQPDNPVMMRRILDELVQVDENYYFGKAWFRLTASSWHLVFYFALQKV